MGSLITRKKRLMMQNRDIPSAYQKLDYIWGDGRQYIITDVFPSANDIVEIEYQLFSTEINTGMFGCSYRNISWNVLGTNTNFNGYFAQIGDGNNYKQSSISKDTARHKHILDIQNRKYIIDNTETDLSNLTLTLANNKYSIWFYNGAGPSYIRHTSGRIYHCRIKGKIDLFPCQRISDGEFGLYDVIHHKFYTNDGVEKFHYTDLLYDCMNIDNYFIASSSTLRWKTIQNNEIYIDNDVITLQRSANVNGLSFVLGYLEKNKTYKISGQFGNIDGNAYIGRIDYTTITVDNSDGTFRYSVTRKATTAFSNGSVNFTPQEDGLYEVLLWSNNTNNITAQNVQVTEVTN